MGEETERKQKREIDEVAKGTGVNTEKLNGGY